MEKIKAGIVGGTGFTAGELIRILLYHPNVEISFVTSQSLQGYFITDVHKDLVGETTLKFENLAQPADIIFLCLPHGESKNWLIENEKGIAPETKIIDLGNDFRVDEEWNEKKFIYGLSEFNKEKIAKALYIANPGCFATAIQLGILPILKQEKIEKIHCVGITGSTGAGKALHQSLNFNWRNDNISPYKTFTHQHIAEIEKSISLISDTKTDINFIPWRGDFTRGIFVSLMMESDLSQAEIEEIYKYAYKYSKFVFVSASPIDMKQVANTNKALIYIEKVGKNLAVHVAIDNLLKGASGQAIQNMNLMFGFNEKAGLNLKPSVF
ncbi:N-acetyl-gamma-glutamyl-phosphate reductase [Flavobacteriaceae bacterium JJC]|uniref:N-acetyl-gamma-glutamyl-phosphate reductase n=1 Tax=Kaistella soli TaxID=2849654 RepID=UPI000B4BCAED|nr:N-acetyl-gamma-glutamyl-phosphate reductase [Kaistella soli]MBU8881804.1 N-acetyl-gamma-glutamyl-phosphate reductase [Kaistella soli]OWK74065.1 N-acetyl-gamma-glutamyl-phosphate reductase [Flavobacteriaceae bacterium JJC]